jgi:hypothetical protein
LNTLVVNLFAGPGTGKSTNAALAYGKLKCDGVKAELVTEFAKDLVWEGREKALGFQPYIIGKQMFHIHRLLGEVEVIITDSPILFGVIYNADGYGPSWRSHIWEVFNSWNTLNIHLLRNSEAHPYVEEGRTQSEAEAKLIDDRIFELIRGTPKVAIRVGEGDETANQIVAAVKERLNG